MIFLQRMFSQGSNYGVTFAQRVSFYFLLFLNVGLLLTFTPQDADAARRRVIFQLANLRQWTDLEYQYSGNEHDNKQGEDRSSQGHDFKEDYHIGIDYAILNQRLSNGSLDIDLGLNQSYERESGPFGGSDNSNGLAFEYVFDMLLFERRPYPVFLTSSRQQEWINAPFTRDYEQTNSNFSAAISVQNQFLPARLSYRHYESKTDGLSFDRSNITDELVLDGVFETGSVSITDLMARSSKNASNIEGSASTDSTENYEMSVKNSLKWTTLSRQQVLKSQYRISNDSGISDIKSTRWNEWLTLQLGEALDAGFTYSRDNTESRIQNRQQEKSEAWIQHRLFKSLTSQYQYNVNRSIFDSGEELNWQHQLNFNYAKELPKHSQLNIAYSYVYGETDRDLNSRELFSLGEQLTVQLDANYLANPDVIQSSIEVYNSDRSILYTEGIDYQLVTIGRQTELIFFLPFPSGGINLGDTLYVNYAYEINSSIEYSTTRNSGSASIGLFDQRYNIYASLGQTDQKLIDGEADASPLIQQTSAKIGFRGNLIPISFGSSYQYLDSNTSKDGTFEAFVNYLREKDQKVLNIRLTERYVSNRQKGFSGANIDTITNKNRFMLNIDYRRQLARKRAMILRAHLIDIRGGGREQNDVSFGATLETAWYKFQLRVNADVTWQILNSELSRNERVNILLRRYF